MNESNRYSKRVWVSDIGNLLLWLVYTTKNQVLRRNSDEGVGSGL